MLRSIVALALSACVSSLSAGCAPVGPNYKRPEMQSPSAYRFVQEPEQAQSLADLPWWEPYLNLNVHHVHKGGPNAVTLVRREYRRWKANYRGGRSTSWAIAPQP